MKKLILLPLFLLLLGFTASATHLKGGFIRYVHLEGRTYSIVVTIYADSDSPVKVGESATLDFGDGTVIALSNYEKAEFTAIPIRDGIYRSELVLQHMYPSNGSYTITYTEHSRDHGILNLENSSNKPFYVESFVLVDNQVQNTSAQLKAYPPFTAYQSQTYYYNPKAVDPNGDSLSFHFSAARVSTNETAADYT